MTMKKYEKFYSALENLEKCPGCRKKFDKNIILCEAGHSFCQQCTLQTPQRCGLISCGKPFSGIQNLLGKELLQQFNSIKIYLIQSDKSSNDKKKVQAQPYSCKITRDCKFTGYIIPMIQHCKNSHPLEFDENTTGTLPHKQNWQMDFSNNLNRTFNISQIGLFGLYISKDHPEKLIACVLMYAPSIFAYQYFYRIEVECSGEKLSYNDQVDSSRIPMHILQSGRKGLVIDCKESLYHKLKQSLRFKCTVTIEKKNQNALGETNSNDGIVQENQQQKKRKNRRKNASNNEETNKSLSNSHLEKNNIQTNLPIITEASKKKLTLQKISMTRDIDQSCSEKKSIEVQTKAAVTNKHEFVNSQDLNKKKPPNIVIHPVIEKSQSNQLYPNLERQIQRLPLNQYPTHQRCGNNYGGNGDAYHPQMVNSHFNTTNVTHPSAPYERPPAINPHYQSPQGSSGATYTTNSRERKNECLLS